MCVRGWEITHSFQCPPQPKPQHAVTIAVSSRTLFNMVHERKIYEEEGLEKYVAYQILHESEPLQPGAAFPFVKVNLLRRRRLKCLPRVWSSYPGIPSPRNEPLYVTTKLCARYM